MKNKYTVSIQWSEEDKAYVARVKEWRYCAGHGHDHATALREVLKAADGMARCSERRLATTMKTLGALKKRKTALPRRTN